MFKLTLMVSLMFIGTTLLAARMSCDSCGSECAPACGTRRFRTCCFNYLRKKRGPENELWSPKNVVVKYENSVKANLPYFYVENIPEQKTSSLIADEYEPYFLDDYVNNRAEV